MGWPVPSLGNDFYALVMGIWCRIVGVCECVVGGGEQQKQVASLKS